MSALGNRLRAELRAWIDGAFSNRKQEKVHRVIDALDADAAALDLDEAFVKRYDVVVGWSAEDSVYIAKVANDARLNYVKAHGLTPAEAIRELAVATDLALSVLTQDAAYLDIHKHCADRYREDPLGFICAPDCPGPSMAARDAAEEEERA
jgi:predicted RNase H-like HicB family nuclease